MEKTEFIYRVAFSEAPLENDARTAFYFGSLTAIYDLFSPEQIGASLKTLWNKKVSEGNIFSNEKVLISREPIYRKAKKNPHKTKNLE